MTTEALKRPDFRHWLRHYWPHVLIPFLWILLCLFSASQRALSGNGEFMPAFRLAAADWVPWVILSPVIFLIAEHFPPVHGQRVKSILISAVTVGLAIYAAETIFRKLNPMPPPPSAAMAGQFDGVGPGDGFGPPPDFGPGFDGPPPPPDANGNFFPAGRPGGGRAGRGGPPPRPADGSARGGPGDAAAMGGSPAAGRAGGRPDQGPMLHVLQFHMPMAILIVMAAHSYSYARRVTEKERVAAQLSANLSDARLSALQMQIQPHFLFNALNAVSSLVHTNPQMADDMIANLSELLRRALSANRQREVTLAEELRFLECYLEIERVRFGERLRVNWQIEETARGALVPVLILQPLVENAVRHGIERRTVDVGVVTIEAGVHAGRLRVTVTDNGPGLPGGRVGAPKGHGIGVGNSRARLESMHGSAASLLLENVPEGGCSVTLEMPFNPNKTES